MKRELRKWLKWGVLVALSYGLFLLLMMPVGWLAPKLPLPADLQLSGLSGTIWQGEAKQLQVQQLQWQQVQWQWDSKGLLRGELAWQVRASGDVRVRARAGARLSLSGISMFTEQALLDAPADQLLSRFRLPVPLAVQGDLSLNLRNWQKSLSGAGWCDALSGDLWWQSASGSSFGQNLQLGDLNASLDCEENGALLAIVSGEGGQVLPELQASLQPDGQAQVDGFLLPGEDIPSNVRSLLGMMGRPDSQGRWPIRLRQRLL